VDLSVDYIGLGPSPSSDVVDRAERSRVPPTTPRFTRSAGVKLGTAGLLAGLNQAAHEPTDHPAESTRRLDTARTPGTPRSLAARDARPGTAKDASMSVSGTGVSSPVMSARLKPERRTSASADDFFTDDRLLFSAIQKVCCCLVFSRSYCYTV